MATYYVKTDGSDVADGLSWANGWATIQKAADTATAGDTVYVAGNDGTYGTGTYTLSASIDFDTNTGNSSSYIFFIAINGTVIIDGDSTAVFGFNFASGKHYQVFLKSAATDGWEIKNTTSHGIAVFGYNNIRFFSGMAIHNTGSRGIAGTRTSTIVFNCDIYSNSSGGIWDSSSSHSLFRTIYCRVRNNSGEGIMERSSYGMHINNLVYGNSYDGITTINGGFIALIIQNTVHGNATGASDAGILSGTHGQIIVNNIIKGHNGAGDSGLNAGNKTPFILNYNCYHDNTDDLIGTAGGAAKGYGAVNSDPSFTDAAGEDFSLASGSPCIATGLPDSNEAYDAKRDIGAVGQVVAVSADPVISNQQLNTYAIDLTGEVIATCDVTLMTATDEVYVEINGKVWKLDTTDNAAFTKTINGYDIGECSAQDVKFIAKNATGADEDNAGSTLTVSNTGTAYTVIKNKLISKLQTVSKLQEVVDSWEFKFDGFPSANVIPVEGEADYETTAENERIYNFEINLIYANDDVDNAKDALLDLVDDVLDTLDQDQTLTGITLPSAYAMIAVQPTFAGWEEIESRKYLVAKINTRVRVSVDIT